MYDTLPTRRRAAQELMRTGAGAAYGTAKAGIGIAGIGTCRPDLIMKVRRAARPANSLWATSNHMASL